MMKEELAIDVLEGMESLYLEKEKLVNDLKEVCLSLLFLFSPYQYA